MLDDFRIYNIEIVPKSHRGLIGTEIDLGIVIIWEKGLGNGGGFRTSAIFT